MLQAAGPWHPNWPESQVLTHRAPACSVCLGIPQRRQDSAGQSDPRTAEGVLSQPADPCLKTDIPKFNRHKQAQEKDEMKAKCRRAEGRTDPRGNTYFRQEILKEAIVEELRRPLPLPCPISNPSPGTSSFACPVFPMSNVCPSIPIGSLVQVAISLPSGTSSQWSQCFTATPYSSPSPAANHSTDRIMCVAFACPNFLKHSNGFPLLQGRQNLVTWLARCRLPLTPCPPLLGGSAPFPTELAQAVPSAQNALPACCPRTPPPHTHLLPARAHRSEASAATLFLGPSYDCLPYQTLSHLPRLLSNRAQFLGSILHYPGFLSLLKGV